MTKNKQIIPTSDSPDESAINSWFEELIDHVRADHFMYSTGVVTVEKKQFYDDMIFGNGQNVVSEMRQTSSKFFISAILNDYLSEIKASRKRPLTLSMALSDSKILVWAEINDNDEETEDALLIAEAKVNGKYYEKGFYLNSTILEKSDNLKIPPHYQKIIE